MAEDAERHLRRATFDAAAQVYEDARPVAPAEVLDELVSLARLEPGSRLLEIGCGTGQATLPLAERGFSILAVELGASLAELAREKLAPFPEVEVETSSFEAWDPGGRLFDAVVAFNSFHWLDSEIRFAKPASVLQPGGSLAVYGSGFVVHEGADPAWLEVFADEASTAGFERRGLEDVRDRSDEFGTGGHFGAVTRSTYVWDLAYEAEAYIRLLASMSTYRALDDDVRAALFERVEHRIRASGGSVKPTRFDVLYVATTA